jgi:hypothetical protein
VSATPGIHEHMLAALRRCPGLHAEADHYELMMNVDAVFADERTMTVLEDGSGRKSQEADHQVDQSLNPSTGEVAVILPAPATRDLTEAEWAVVNGDSVEITDGAAAKLRWRMSHRILVHIPTLLREIEALATRVSPDLPNPAPPPVASRGTKPGAVVPTATAPGSTKATS